MNTVSIDVGIDDFVGRCFEEDERDTLLREVFERMDAAEMLEEFTDHYNAEAKAAIEELVGPVSLTDRDRVLLENALRGMYRSCELVGVMTPELKSHLQEMWARLNLSVDKPLTYKVI